VPVYWPGGVRHGGGASPVCGFCMERGKADADTAARAPKGVVAARGSALGGGNREALSTVAASAGGPARSSGEASVTGVE
jgi:hypothetical protein